MLRKVTVLSSDAVNRNHIMIPAVELMRGLRSHHVVGLPNLVGHDAHRPVGWTYPRAVYVRPQSTLLLGDIFVAESETEHTDLTTRYQEHVRDRHARETRRDLEPLKHLLAGHADGAKVLYVGTTAMEAKGLARRAAPEAFAGEDKDGLVPLRALETIIPGVYRVGELAVFAHPFFRRSLSRHNNLNGDLLFALETLRSDKAAGNLRIRLDPDMIGLASGVKSHIELVYWHGPKFSDDLTAIPLGVCRHEATEQQRLFYGLSRTEFWWHAQNELQTLEAEEVRDSETFAAESVPEFGCRYVHSIIAADGHINHLDGAIRGYDAEGMIARLGLPISTAGRRSQYTKLWRVDGRLALGTWKSLIHHHFRENPLIAEYFGHAGSAEEPMPLEDPNPPLTVHDLVPYMLDEDDPLRLMVSMYASPDDRPPGRVVVSAQTLDGRPTVPADIVDIRKLLSERNELLSYYPADPLRVYANDDYFEFPLIIHDDRGSLTTTREVILELLGGWASRDPGRAVAVNLGLAAEGSDVVLGVAGRIDAVLAWLRRDDWFPDGESDEAWLSAAKAACQGHDRTTVAGIVLPSWTVGFRRVVIDRELIEDVKVVNGDLTVSLRVPKSKSSLLPLFASGSLRIRHFGVLRSGQCTRCGEEYSECPCLKIRDGAMQRIGDTQLVSFHWTNVRVPASGDESRTGTPGGEAGAADEHPPATRRPG